MADKHENIINGPPLDPQEINKGLGEIFYERMINHNLNVAQIDALTGEKDTFASLLSRCVKLAIALKSFGVAEEDVILSCSINTINSCLPFISTQFLGAIAATLDSFTNASDNAQLLEIIRPKIVFTSKGSLEMIEEALSLAGLSPTIIVLDDTSTKYKNLSDLLGSVSSQDEFEPTKVKNMKKTAVVFFSSGSSGLPKGICLSHFCLYNQANNMAKSDNMDLEVVAKEQKRLAFPLTTLNFLTLYAITGGVTLIASIIHGSTRLLCNYFSPESMWKYLDKYKVFLLFIPPSAAVEICKFGRPENINTNGLLRLVMGGTKASKEMILNLRRLFPGTDVYQCYSQTELGGSTLAFQALNKLHRKLFQEKPESCGLPCRGISCKVVDPDTEQVLGPNQKGELRVKSECLMNGYYNQDASGEFDSDGWFKTGDLAHFDEDNCFFIEERIKETVKYKDWHIVPTLLENHLLTHPDVRQAVVFGIPDEECGELVTAMVVKKNSSEITEVEINEYLETRVSDRQRLRGGLYFIDELPMTATGKILRRLVKKDFLVRKYNITF